MDPSEQELMELLMKIGRALLDPPSSTTALRTVLDKAGCLLTNVEQSPTISMHGALVPLMKALVSDKLVKHSDTNVKVRVTSCITEITRITAPDAPYDDDKMKVVFQLTVEAFEKLSNTSDRCYTTAVSILDAVARVRSCLIMLDLKCDNLVLGMFQRFLKLIRSNHPHAVFSAMETIMTTVLNESEDISLDLVSTILASVKKENQEVAPISWKLGEKVISSCAAKLQPYIIEAVQSVGSALDDYAPIVTSICQNETEKKIDAEKHVERFKKRENKYLGCLIKAYSRKSQQHHSKSKIIDAEVITEPDNLGSRKADNSLDSVPKKRVRKPNSLMKPEEGYDHHWIGSGWKKPVLANDGGEEILNLKNQRYELINDDVLLVEDEEMAVQKSEASSDILQKRGKKIKSESAIKEKLSSSTRRSKASARKKSNVKSVQSSGKAACSPMLEKPIISSDSTDDASSPDDSLNENDKKTH